MINNVTSNDPLKNTSFSSKNFPGSLEDMSRLLLKLHNFFSSYFFTLYDFSVRDKQSLEKTLLQKNFFISKKEELVLDFH